VPNTEGFSRKTETCGDRSSSTVLSAGAAQGKKPRGRSRGTPFSAHPKPPEEITFLQQASIYIHTHTPWQSNHYRGACTWLSTVPCQPTASDFNDRINTTMLLASMSPPTQPSPAAEPS